MVIVISILIPFKNVIWVFPTIPEDSVIFALKEVPLQSGQTVQPLDTCLKVFSLH